MSVTSDKIFDDLKNLSAVKPKAHDKIFDEFLEEIEKVDFRQILNLKDAEKIPRNNLVVAIVDEILRLIRSNDFGLCAKNDFVYLFNGAYWKPIDREELRSFLGKAAEQLGIIDIEAKHFAFREQLYKQFICVANSPKASENERVLINLQNGTLEISRKGVSLQAFSREDFLTYQLSFSFDKNADCPLFFNYLNEVLPDKSLQNVLAEFIAYCFTRHLKLEKCLFLYGSGANGKSVLFEIICAIFGRENVTNFSLSNLIEEHNRALINNKLLNYSSELSGKKVIDSDLFKQLVSGETVQCRLKYGNPFFAHTYAKLMFNCNELPRDVEFTEAFFRRFLIIPFEVTIPEEKQDKELSNKIIKDELSGVFNWILEGLNRLLKQKKFSQSSTVNKTLNEFREQSDSVHLFIVDNRLEISAENYIPLKSLYFDYRKFCASDGLKALNKSNFIKRLRLKKIAMETKNFGLAIYLERPKKVVRVV